MQLRYDELIQTPNKRFTQKERKKMLALSGVGPSVIERIEELGFSKIADLQDEDPRELAYLISKNIGSTCWRNSPQARKALSAIVSLARSLD